MHAVVLVSRRGGGEAPLVEQFSAAGWRVDRVWTGDPHLRPSGPWADGAPIGPGGVPDGLVRAALPAILSGLVLGLGVVARGDGPGLVLDAERVTVRRAPALPAGAVGLVARGVPPLDGLAPDLDELARSGPYSTAVLSATPELAATLVERLLGAAGDAPAGPTLAAAVLDRPVDLLPGEVLGWPLEGPAAHDPGGAAVIDVSHLHPTEPWRLDVGWAPARVRLSDRPDLPPVTTVAGTDEPLRLPGGIEVDPIIRHLVAAEVRRCLHGAGSLPPDPWHEPVAFAEWLETPAHPWEPVVGRYWYALWHARPDLRAAFPDPGGDDLVAFRDWTTRRPRYEGAPAFLRPVVPTRPWRSEDRRPGGVDVVGYFGSEMSLANVADRMVASLRAADIAHRTVELTRTGSPRRERPGSAATDALAHDTVVLVANHDQVPAILAEHGDVLRGRRLVGYWHWDVEHVPPVVAARMRHFEQIWVLNEYTERSLAAVPGAPPVRSLPLPVPEPHRSAASRADLGLPVDRPVVLVTLDHLSVTERKNPLGAIEAFRRAFPEPTPTGPVLVVKTMNADQRWIEHERIRMAARERSDVVVVDRLLAKPDQMALVAHADVLLSLHRAEGLGLHLVEAMWLGTPTIATRYSGNLSFMDDDDSLLVDARLVPVERGEGFFPPEATWADPDLDQAAAHLRRLVGDPDLRRELAVAGRARMERQPSFDEIGRTIAAWCGIDRTVR